MKDETSRTLRAIAREIPDDESLGRLALRSGLVSDAEVGWALRAALMAPEPPPAEPAATSFRLEELERLEEPSASRVEELDRWCDRVGAWISGKPDGQWSGTAPELVAAVPGYPWDSLRALGTRLGHATVSGRRQHGFRVVRREYLGGRFATYTLSAR